MLFSFLLFLLSCAFTSQVTSATEHSQPSEATLGYPLLLTMLNMICFFHRGTCQLQQCPTVWTWCTVTFMCQFPWWIHVLTYFRWSIGVLCHLAWLLLCMNTMCHFKVMYLRTFFQMNLVSQFSHCIYICMSPIISQKPCVKNSPNFMTAYVCLGLMCSRNIVYLGSV